MMKKLKTYDQFIGENNQYFQYNNMIDYTLLEDSSTDEDIINLCKKADMLGVKSVCVLPKFVSLAKEYLVHSNVLVCTVISFPKGSDNLQQKIAETNQVISDGADEVDMVLNYHLLKESIYNEANYDILVEEVKSLVDICHSNTNKDGMKVTLKVIVESGLLTIEQTEIATKICLEAGADFIKTSTGKVAIGAQMDKINAMFNTIKNSGKQMMIKASGGVRTIEQINSMMGKVDRFGMGYASVDKLNGITDDVNQSSY